MAKTPEIRNLKEFLEPSLDGLKIVDYSTKFLTSPGDNYGSTMLALSVNCLDENDEKKTLELVAKMRPAKEEFINLFQVDVTFVKESGIYMSVAPALINLQKERGILEEDLLNTFCKCYASRFSLDVKSKVVNEDALMVLENLKFKGFVTGDRRAGFQEKDTLFILENLAKVHATTVVLKYLKPDTFETDVRPFLDKIDVDAGLPEEAQEKFLVIIEQDLEKIHQDSDTVKRAIKQIRTNRTPTDVGEDDRPFCSVLHNDFWVNNMMIAYDENGVINKFKMLDFQLTQLGSPVRDVLFFIFTSIADNDLVQTFDNYLNHYHISFLQTIMNLNYPIDEFVKEKFDEELDIIAPLELYHIVSMLRVVMARKEEIPDHSEMNVNFFVNENIIGEDYYDQLNLIIQTYEVKKWIR